VRPTGSGCADRVRIAAHFPATDHGTEATRVDYDEAAAAFPSWGEVLAVADTLRHAARRGSRPACGGQRTAGGAGWSVSGPHNRLEHAAQREARRAEAAIPCRPVNRQPPRAVRRTCPWARPGHARLLRANRAATPDRLRTGRRPSAAPARLAGESSNGKGRCAPQPQRGYTRVSEGKGPIPVKRPMAAQPERKTGHHCDVMTLFERKTVSMAPRSPATGEGKTVTSTRDTSRLG